MGKLDKKTPCDGLLPIEVNGCVLEELTPNGLVSVSVPEGNQKTAEAALGEKFGFGFPRPGQRLSKGGVDLVWFGPRQAMLVGARAKRIKGTALVEQSDAWAVMRLSGEQAEAALARLVPIDLRASVFKTGHTARSVLFHAPLSISRTGKMSFDIMVFRSMAQTAVHEIETAMMRAGALADG